MIPLLNVLAPRRLPFSSLTYIMITRGVGPVKGCGRIFEDYQASTSTAIRSMSAGRQRPSPISAAEAR